MIYLKDSKLKVKCSEGVAKVFRDLLHLEGIERDKEYFYVMHLNVRSVGTLTSSFVHPRETFRRAIVEGAAAIIIAHNHPSGETDPSDEDTRATRNIFEAGQILGIKMLDHIIFTNRGFYSFKENREWKS